MSFLLLSTGISAAWKRDLELRRIVFSDGGVQIELEEELGNAWSIRFASVLACNVTSEECSGGLISRLPDEGAIFVDSGAAWIRENGGCHSRGEVSHYVICCYDEVIEVLSEDSIIVERLDAFS